MTTAPTKPDPAQATAGTVFTLLAATGFAAVSILTARATATGLTLATVLAWRYVLAAVILTLWVGTHDYKRIPPREMLRFLTIGGYHFDLRFLPSGPFGQDACYVEPAIGQLKQAMKFRRFLLRGRELVNMEWSLACTAFDIRKMYAARTRPG